MIRKFFITALVTGSSYFMTAQTYITHVTLADVENHKLHADRTVVIQGDRITDIQPSNKIKVPENGVILDGTGKYLIPGLTDAHIHFFQNGGLYTRPDVIDLRKYQPYSKEIQHAKDDMEHKLWCYLKNGITNVIDVGATINFLKHRNTLQKNDTLSSTYMTGPLLTTYLPKVYEGLGEDSPFILTQTAEEAVKAVQSQLPFKPDFIKIWYITGADGLGTEASAKKNLPVIKAIIDEAHSNGLKVAVHASERIAAQLSVENGADFLVHFVHDELLKDDFIQLMKRNKTILIPTLIVPSGYNDTFGQTLEFSDHELVHADPHQLGSLLDLKHLPDTVLVAKYKTYTLSQKVRSRHLDSIARANIKRLSDAGVVLATGTDAGNIGTLHTSSYLSELKAMQQSGMDNWQILTASTINGAKVLGKENEFGSIAKNKKANLILLDANPIEDLENLTHIHRVINNGIPIDPDDILQDTPEDMAQRQLNAYNLRNIEAFLEPYADDVEVYHHPNTLQFKGKEAMRKTYAPMFKNTPDLHCELVGRLTQGNTVIDKERVRSNGKTMEAIAIYQIENGKIQKVYFIR